MPLEHSWNGARHHCLSDHLYDCFPNDVATHAPSLDLYYESRCDCQMDIGISNQQAGPSSSVASQPVAGPGSSVMARLLADEAEMEEGEIDELLSVQASDQAPSQRNSGVSTNFVSQPEPPTWTCKADVNFYRGQRDPWRDLEQTLGP